METVDYSMLRKSEFGPPGQMIKQFPRIGIQSEASHKKSILQTENFRGQNYDHYENINNDISSKSFINEPK